MSTLSKWVKVRKKDWYIIKKRYVNIIESLEAKKAQRTLTKSEELLLETVKEFLRLYPLKQTDKPDMRPKEKASQLLSKLCLIEYGEIKKNRNS